MKHTTETPEATVTYTGKEFAVQTATFIFQRINVAYVNVTFQCYWKNGVERNARKYNRFLYVFVYGWTIS